MDSLIREMQGVSAQTNRLGMSPVSMAKGVVSKLGIYWILSPCLTWGHVIDGYYNNSDQMIIH